MSHDTEAAILPFRQPDEGRHGPYARAWLLAVTDSRISDGEYRLLQLILIRSQGYQDAQGNGYTRATWKQLAEDLGKKEKTVAEMGAHLVMLGAIKTWTEPRSRVVAKQVVPADTMYGEAQANGWALLREDRDAIDLDILHSTPPEIRVLTPGNSGSNPRNSGIEPPEKPYLRKRIKNKKLKIEIKTGGCATGCDQKSEDVKKSRSEDDNHEKIDDQGMDMSEDKKNSSIDTNPHGDGTSFVDQKKEMTVDERAERLRNLSRMTMAQTDAKSRQKAAKAEERRRRREEAGAEAPRRASLQERKEAAGVVNSGNVRGWWDEAYAEALPGRPNPRWSKKDMALVKQLLEDFGPELVEEGVRDFISNWETKWSRKYKAEGLPEISLLYFKRAEVLGKISRNDGPSGTKKPEPKFF